MPFSKELYDLALRAIKVKGIVAYGPRVLVLRDVSEEKTKGGLVIPDEAKRKKRSGTVVALGQGYEKASSDEYVEGVTIGYQVMFNAYDAIEYDLETSEGTVALLAVHVGNLYMGWPNKEVEANGA